MIHFLTVSWHGYTFRPLKTRLAVPIEFWNYDRLFTRRVVPGGTWLFADLERLSPYELRLAAEAARLLRAGGSRILNDPAVVKPRLPMLRALHTAGINAFNAYVAEDQPRPARFPVFIRVEADHAGPITPLIATQAELDATLSSYAAAGRPLRGLMVVEYCAEEIRPGVWRKLGAFRIGARSFMHTTVVDYGWQAKTGDAERLAKDPMRETYIKEEFELLDRTDLLPTIDKAMAIAGIDYGRADFGLVGGRPQIYEINTNPVLGLDGPRPFAARLANHAKADKRVLEAIAALDSDGPEVKFDSPVLDSRQGLRQRLLRSPYRP